MIKQKFVFVVYILYPIKYMFKKSKIIIEQKLRKFLI